MLAKTNKMLRTELLKNFLIANHNGDTNVYLVFSDNTSRDGVAGTLDENAEWSSTVEIKRIIKVDSSILKIGYDTPDGEIIGSRKLALLGYAHLDFIESDKAWNCIYFNCTTVAGSETYNSISVVSGIRNAPGEILTLDDVSGEFLNTLDYSKALILMQTRTIDYTLPEPATAAGFPVLINL